MKFNLQPYLTGELVTLHPLRQDHFDELYEVAADPLIWEQHQTRNRHEPEGFRRFFNESIASKGALVVLDSNSQKVIGSSRFKIIDATDLVIEIGWSFLARRYWGGLYNREIKKLMVNYALRNFEKVVFYVDAKNYRSQRALQKLGAQKMESTGESWVLPKDKGVTFLIDNELK